MRRKFPTKYRSIRNKLTAGDIIKARVFSSSRVGFEESDKNAIKYKTEPYPYKTVFTPKKFVK